MGPAVHTSLPNVWKAVWALVTRPPHLAPAVRLDQNMTKMSVQLFMTLSLQLLRKQADLGPAVKLGALLLFSATANAIGMPCRSACMRTAVRAKRI